MRFELTIPLFEQLRFRCASDHMLSVTSSVSLRDYDPQKKLNSVPESGRKLYRPSNCRLYAKLVPTFTDRGSCVVSMTDPYSRILGFLDRD
jgi:hypothetical protein